MLRMKSKMKVSTYGGDEVDKEKKTDEEEYRNSKCAGK